MNLASDLIRLGREHPDEIGLVHSDGRTLTFGELLDGSCRLASCLRSRGVGQGDRVAVCLSNGPELVLSLFAAWINGSVAVPISSLYNDNELTKSVRSVQPVLLVTAEARSLGDKGNIPQLVVAASYGTSDWDRVIDGADPLEQVEVDDDAEAVILFTGGTTGDPKAVIKTHGASHANMVALAKSSKGGVAGPFPLAPEDVPPNLIVLPLFHGGGMQAMLFAFYTGRRVVLLERFRVDDVARVVAEHKIANLFLLPTMIFDLVHADAHVKLDSVKRVLVAGQALDPGVKAEFERRYGVLVFSNYGSAEVGHVAGWSPSDVANGYWVPGSVGRLYDGVQVEIRDGDGHVVPSGTVGEICVKATQTKGYVDAGDDGPLVVDGWVRSGDVGHVTDDRVLFLSGRVREMIKTGGFQIWPSEIETELRTHPGVRDVAVAGVPDDRLGEIPKAYVVPSDGYAGSVDFADELIAYSRERLAHFKMVRAVKFIQEVPRSEVGKAQRLQLVHEDGELGPSHP